MNDLQYALPIASAAEFESSAAEFGSSVPELLSEISPCEFGDRLTTGVTSDGLASSESAQPGGIASGLTTQQWPSRIVTNFVAITGSGSGTDVIELSSSATGCASNNSLPPSRRCGWSVRFITMTLAVHASFAINVRAANSPALISRGSVTKSTRCVFQSVQTTSVGTICT